MQKVFEIVSYSLNDNQKESEFLIASDKMQNEVMPKTKGFIGRKVLKNTDGLFCDIVMWQSMVDAQNAMQTVMQNQTCLKMFAFIDENSITMDHFNILSANCENLDFMAGAVEIGTVKLNNNNQIKEVVENAEIVRANYLQKQNGFVAQFVLQKEDGIYGEVMFNKNDIKETEQICTGYFTNEDCKKYLSYFNAETTELKYWSVL
jgi:hypothetical protein